MLNFSVLCIFPSIWLVMNHIYLIYILSGRYLLEEKADDSILLTLVIHIMDALVNSGNGHCIWLN